MSLRRPAGFIRPGYDPLEVPNAPTIGTATAGDASATVTFTAPSNIGGAAISAYYAVSNPGQITTTGASSPITVTGLSNGTAYTFKVWALNSYGPSPYSASSGSATPNVQRGLFGGGTTGSNTNVIEYISIATIGNSASFGELTSARRELAACASTSRGIFGGGATGIAVNTIDYVTVASAGNATDFGDLTVARYALAAVSSGVTGVFAGGLTRTNVIDYITIASAGDATDFGDLLNATEYLAGCSNTTRGLFAGGDYAGGITNIIQYITIASAGDATDFGDLTQVTYLLAACASATRGVFGGGNDTRINVISYVTIASTGNATDFGDLTQVTSNLSACSSATRGVFGGGLAGSGGGARTNVISYITIASVGNATDFGDLSQTVEKLAACSNCGGGLT